MLYNPVAVGHSAQLIQCLTPGGHSGIMADGSIPATVTAPILIQQHSHNDVTSYYLKDNHILLECIYSTQSILVFYPPNRKILFYTITA